MATSSLQPKRSVIITGIILILVLLFLLSLLTTAPVLHMLGLAKVNGTLFFVSRMSYWACLLLLTAYSIKIEKQPLLIWKEKNYNLFISFLSIIIILVVLYIGSYVVAKILSLMGMYKKSEGLSELIDIFKSNNFLLVFTALTAGVVEEIIFRGYLLPRLEIFFKKPYISIIVSSLLFGLLHYKYGTIINVMGPIFIGFVFAVYYWRFRNISILIICHFLWDLVVLYLSIYGKVK